MKIESYIGEIWKDIPGYDGKYQVSNFGRIKSFNTRNGEVIIKKLNKHKGGYLQVDLWKNSKAKVKFVHRLVAEAFIPNPDNLPCVNHKDEDKTNNCATNLEWCSYTFNNNYGTRNKRLAKTKGKTVLQYDLDGNLVKEWVSVMEVKRQTGWSQGNISCCCVGKQRSAYGYKWKYAE
jgi:hypothetical protein